MPKSTDVPHELRAMNKVFEQIARRWEYSQVFNDFLTIALNWFLVQPQKLEWKRYDRKELDLFNELFRTFMITMRDCIHEHGWYDALGEFYQVLSSSSKKSAFGQFFTPRDLCSAMAQMTPIDGTYNKVNDPACGSGRTLMASHVAYQNNFMFGEDLDPMCCKMAAINFVIHGCQGEIVNMNSLSRAEYRQGWRINRMLHITGIPCIEEIPAEQSFSFGGFNCWPSRIEEREVLDDGCYVYDDRDALPIELGQIVMNI